MTKKVLRGTNPAYLTTKQLNVAVDHTFVRVSRMKDEIDMLNGAYARLSDRVYALERKRPWWQAFLRSKRSQP